MSAGRLTIVFALLAAAGVAAPASASTLLVADYNSSAIKTLSNGTVGTFSANAAINGPVGIAVDAAGDVFVTNYNVGTIDEITSNGGTLTQISSGLTHATGIAVVSGGNVFFVDNSGNIDELTPTGAMSYSQSTFYTGYAANDPEALSVDASGDLLVATQTNGAVYKLTTTGTPNSTLLGAGLTDPDGIAVNGGTIYVAERGTAQSIVTLPLAGGSVSSFVSSGLNNPTGLAIDGAGDVYVANEGSGTVAEYTAAATLLTTTSGFNDPEYIAFAVPEPASLAVLAAGLLGMAAVRRRRA